MKKIIVIVVLALIAVGTFTGVAAAASNQPQTGFLHDYMEKAFAQKLGIAEATVEAQIAAGKTLYQIPLDHGIAQADLPAFMLEVRTNAIKAAQADGVVSQAWAERMLQSNSRGAGYGMGYGMGYGVGSGGFGPCGGTGVPVGTGGNGYGRGRGANQ